jgi:Tfp pilus assembly protein PilF
MSTLRFAHVALLALLVPLAASCADEPVPQPKTPVNAPGQPSQGQPPIVGMTDTPSSVKLGETPPPAVPTNLTGAAVGTYQQALAAFARGDLQQARTLFTQVTKEDPKAHQAFYSLGVVQERLRDSGAGSSYREAFGLVPSYEPAIVAYGVYQARKGNASDADRFLTEKHASMPKSAAIAAALAEVKSLEKDTGAAQRLAQEALKLNPDYRPAMVTIARDHFRNRRLDLAIYALQAILDGFGPENPPRDPNNAEARLLRALIWREQGNRAGAIEEFRKAVNLRPDLVEARVELATFLLEAGNADEAKPILEGALAFDSENVGAHLNLGDAQRLLGNYPEAKKHFEWVLAHDASLPQVHYDLGLMYLFAPSIPGMTAQQQVSEATKELKRFQDLRKKGEADDSDELLNRAKLKEGELAAAKAAAEAPPPAPTPSATPSAAPSAAPAAPPAESAQPAAPPAPAAPPPPPAPAPSGEPDGGIPVPF